MQGIYIDGRRPKSKKEIRETANADPGRIEIEATSVFGNEYGGPVNGLPAGQTVTFVGPDPYTSRKFYGQLSRDDGGKVTVK